ncbi:MAG TPA: hypothetical protein VL992_06790 [Tepidisphaeraceae bacterium]|nr:hypothetical protein [Tepidisphaeraceae bacterium]
MTSIPTIPDQAQPSRRMGILLLLIVAIIDAAFMPLQIWPGDAQVWRLETRTFLQAGHLWIDPRIVASTVGEPGQYYDYNPADGQSYSKYGIANSLMAIPPVAAQLLISGNGPISLRTSALILNFWNLLLCLLLAAVLYRITRRYSPKPARRAFFVLACLFGTFLWYYQRAQGSEIYQLIFFALAYEFLLRGFERPRWFWLAWLFVALLLLTRVFFGILIPIFAAFIVGSAIAGRRPLRRILMPLLIPPVAMILLLGWINDLKFGSPWLTGYHQWRPEEHLLTGSWLDGVYGLLFSGHWSVFTYFPVLLIALPGMKKFTEEHRPDFLLILTTFVATLLVLGKIPSWRGEWSYGPRYMLFLLPIVSLPALTVDFGRARVWGFVAAAGLLFSLWLQIEVNRVDFWFFYQVQQPLDRLMDKETAQYFYDHQEGIIIHDLESHRRDLDGAFLFRHLRGQLPPERMEQYRDRVIRELDFSNFYW